MTIYTFYCCRADGFAPVLDAADLAGAAQAEAHAERLLTRHASCTHVEVRLAEEVLFTCAREPVAAQ